MKINLTKKTYHILKYFIMVGAMSTFYKIFFSKKLKNQNGSSWIKKNNLSQNFKNKCIVK